MMISEDEKQVMVRMFCAYCRRALRNARTDILREEARRARRETLFSDMHDDELNRLAAPSPFAGPEFTFEVAGWEVTVVGSALAEAVGVLPKEERDVILLYYFADWTDRQIAEECGYPRSTIQFRRAKALRTLRNHLGKEAVMDDYI